MRMLHGNRHGPERRLYTTREAAELTAAVVAGFKASLGDGRGSVDLREATRQVRTVRPAPSHWALSRS